MGVVSDPRPELERNISLIYTTNFLRGLVFFLPIFALYVQQELFTVLNVTLILSVGAITALIFEVPSGAFADIFGRKKTLLLAGALLLVALAFLSIGRSLAFFLAYAVLNGIAESLFSGTDNAMLYDTLKQLGDETRFKRVIAISDSMWPIGAAISSFIGGFLAASSLGLPVLVTVIPFLLAFVLTFFLIEPVYEREDHKNIFLQMRTGIKTILSNRQILLLSLAGFLFYAFGEVTHQLKPLFFAFKEIPITLYGIMFAVTFALSSLGSFISADVSKHLGDRRTLILSALLPALLFVGAIFAPGIWAGILLAIGSVFWGIRWPIMSHLLNQESSAKQRVTILSFGNLANKLGLAIFAPIFGYIADVYTINTAFMVAAIPSFIVVGVLLFVKE